MENTKQVENVSVETVSAILAAAGINNDIVQDGQALYLESCEVEDGDRVVKVNSCISFPCLKDVALDLLDQ